MRIPILLALLFFSQTFFAQSTPDQRVISVEELIDSTVTVGSFLDLDLQNSPVSITVITQDQIQNSGARHLSELLEIFVPGFQYLFNKWNGIIWGMRGVAADRNTKFIVLVNGHKMNHESRDGAYSELDLGFLSDLEKVEVLRGPAGLVYGSGSIAGVINLVTKRRNKVETVAEQSMETWALHTFGTSNKILVSRVVNEHTHAQLYGGFRISQGSGRGVPRLYGRPSWPYPQGHPSPPANGVPAEGSSWDTPGNFILSGELRLKDWKLYSRFTRQVTNATGMFVLDPWPEIAGAPDSTATPKLVDGVLAPRDGFWGTTESWGNSRRQYQVTNLSLQASRDFTLGIHQFKFRSGLDLVTNRIVFRKLSYFTNSLGNQPEFKYAETFGERRCNLTGTYLLNLSHFHLAAGLDSRIFFFGKDISGQNSQQDKAEHYIVDNVTYFNQAIFAESVLDYKKILIDLGIRYDLHSRTRQHGGFLNTRMGLVYKATKALNFRVIHHSSGNNGSADNYEFNRNTIDDYGNPYSEAHYETPYIKPTENSVPIEPVSLKELRRLKPEKASSTELASYFQNERWILGVSASYNTIKDLFTWNQVSFRTINAGKYNFVNAEWEIRYSQHAFTLGANHVISQLVNTEVLNEKISVNQLVFATDTFQTRLDAYGNTYYSPIAYKNNEGFDSVRQIVLYPVRDAISVDGKNFLNLSSHITKIFVDIRLSPLFSIHSNARLFWGLKGREPIHRFHEKQNANLQHYEADFFQNQKYPYLNTERALQAKWNAGIKFEFKNTTVQFLIYDILAPQYRSKNLHSLRYQQMAFSRIQTDIFAYDFRSYSVRLTLKL